MAMSDETPDYLSMSDEDIMKMNNPASSQASDENPEPKPDDENDKQETSTGEISTENNPADTTVDKEESTPTPEKDGEEDGKSDGNTPSGDEGKSDDEKSGTDPDKSADPDKDKASTDAKDPGKEKPADPAGTPDPATAEAATQAKPVDHKAFYELVMKPFKANGKEIKITSPEEAIRLMQMGAGYGRKLQTLQPALKSLRLLEKHNLLDDAKLSYLIDLDQKNPEAIRKLIKESGIDPLEINTDDPVTYSAPNRSVSEPEMAFKEALTELEAHPQGKATIQEINETWDKEAKQALFQSPELLAVIQDQKDSGLYAVITSEIDRQKTLGLMPHNTSFLKAYKTAGDFLVANGKLGQPSQPQPTGTPADTPAAQPKVVVDTKVATPASPVANDDKAKAAAATKATSSRRATTTTNPLAMSDEEFMKIGQMNL